MGVRSNRSRGKSSRKRSKRGHRTTLSKFWSFLRVCWWPFRTIIRAVLASPPIVRTVGISTLLLLLFLAANWAYQTFHKPTEILFPLDQSLNKRPVETWRQYESLFRKHSTATITPEFLAALAQVEGSGNPMARTYWRWQLTWNPLEWYQPASSAVGMYQITDGTFREAARYCIHDHVVVEEGPWHDLRSCWFNVFYTRLLPSHAIELTAALLDRQVAKAIESRRPHAVTLEQKQNLAAIIHLCGFGKGRTYAARRFRLTPHQRCGDHDVRAYLARIKALKHKFAKISKEAKTNH